MSQKNEKRELSIIQKTAVIYLKKELVEKRREYEKLNRLWNELVREISIGLDIPENERADWKLTPDNEAVIYQPKPKEKDSKKG